MSKLLRFALLLGLCALAAPAVAANEDYWQKVGQALGKEGAQQPGQVYRVALPRTDLHVTLDGVAIKPGLALGGWLAFAAMNDNAMVMGDLVLTCSGDLSRNRHVGKELGSGKPLGEILGSMRMVAEGVETCASAATLGTKFGVDLPIIQQMHAVLSDGKSPQEAVRELMDRTLKGE